MSKDKSAPARSSRGRATSAEARELRRLFELNERQLKPGSAFRKELESNIKKKNAVPRHPRKGGRVGKIGAAGPLSAGGKS